VSCLATGQGQWLLLLLLLHADVWPNIIFACSQHALPLALQSAVLPSRAVILRDHEQ
jgi:hypothetical protein